MINTYYDVLVNFMDAESIGSAMVSNNFIVEDDLVAITDAPSNYIKNSCLLEHVELLDGSKLSTFFTLLQQSSAENNQVIGNILSKGM